MLKVEQRQYSVLQIEDFSQMNFPTGFSKNNPHPVYEEVRAQMGSYVPAMMSAEEVLSEDKRHVPAQLAGIAIGHSRRAEGLWYVHRKFYERSLWEYQRSGALAIQDEKVRELGSNLGIHWEVSSIRPAELEGVDNDPATVGFANEFFQRKGMNRYEAHYGDTTFTSSREPQIVIARIVTQYAGVQNVFGMEGRILSSYDLDHTETPVNTNLLTSNGELSAGVVVPVVSPKSPDWQTGFAYRITSPAEKLFAGVTMYDGEIAFDAKMYSRDNGLVVKHRAGNEYQTKLLLVEEEGKFALLPWCIKPLDMSDAESVRRIVGASLLTRYMFNLQGFDSNDNVYLGTMVAEDPKLRAVVSYCAGGENGASNRTVAGLFQVFKDTIGRLYEGGRLGNLVGENKPFETKAELDHLIDHPESWVTKGQMYAPWETEFDIFRDPKDVAFERLQAA